jgi:polar amino acid transport system permease protein
MSRFLPLKWLTKTFVWIIRGTPLMLQVLSVVLRSGPYLGADAMGRISARPQAFVIKLLCYFSEIYRGGIEGSSGAGSMRPARSSA